MSAKEIKTAARFISREALNCSYYGNPRSRVVFETEDGRRVIAKTATDAAAGYSVSNWEGSARRGLPWVNITYHVTRTGSVIIDYIHDSGHGFAASQIKEGGAE